MKRLSPFLAAGLALSASLACSLLSPGTETPPALPSPDNARATPAPTATLAPSPDPTPTPAPPPAGSLNLGDGLWLAAEHTAESEVRYSLQADRPYLGGALSPQAEAFNSLVREIVEGEVSGFTAAAQELPDLPDAPESSLFIHYTVSTASSRLISLFLNIAGYAEGAAHPYQYTIAVNFDLEAGQALVLGDLFLDGSDYLETIASFCQEVLDQQGLLVFPEGAEPTPDNYRNWNAGPDGLIIIFDTFQIGPGALGPQTVTVPYAQLNDMLDPAGPLGEHAQ